MKRATISMVCNHFGKTIRVLETGLVSNYIVSPKGWDVDENTYLRFSTLIQDIENIRLGFTPEHFSKALALRINKAIAPRGIECLSFAVVEE